ncbi:hypothetical protein [Nonomuraea wenchangensis]|uniref:Uncharacterized protein n=1 Tax=Nonomuraea wenchangensis TaxID=568860 RepID=A0A1I0F1A5_9ACTN|nr:hypothetical protein [Nonomuraea wenchangensis]SET51000.1 hypothetical protein SAMN05421811_103263 [Nonomuraea wenchangensis]
MADTSEKTLAPVADVDRFEVVAEGDSLIVACPDLSCRTRQRVATDWHATIGELRRAASGHEHTYPALIPSKAAEEETPDHG